MKLHLVAANGTEICGFGENLKKIITDDGEILAYVADITDSEGPDKWLHFPRPLKKKKVKAVMTLMELWKD